MQKKNGEKILFNLGQYNALIGDDALQQFRFKILQVANGDSKGQGCNRAAIIEVFGDPVQNEQKSGSGKLGRFEVGNFVEDKRP